MQLFASENIQFVRLIYEKTYFGMENIMGFPWYFGSSSFFCYNIVLLRLVMVNISKLGETQYLQLQNWNRKWKSYSHITYTPKHLRTNRSFSLIIYMIQIFLNMESNLLLLFKMQNTWSTWWKIPLIIQLL
jgi:hypothetical protein